MPLKMALTEAAAPALTAQQEDQIKQTLTDFHNNQGAHMPNQNLLAAQRAYDDAVLAGDSATAQAQATIISTLRATDGASRLQAETSVKIQIVNVLKSNNNQITILQQRFGSAGLSRILNGLVGPGMPPGPPPNGPGMPPNGPRPF
jgi:hypothetical protein